jgi:hypothetical protein
MSRGLTGVLYDRNGNRKTGVKQTIVWALLFPIRLVVEAVILPARIYQFIDMAGPLTGHTN